MITVDNYIYDKYKERGTKTFEEHVKTFLKRNGIEGHIICYNACMERTTSSGRYRRQIEIEVNNKMYYLNDFTNDSMAWDNFTGTPKEKRQLFLSVLDSQIEGLKEYIN